MDKHRRIISQLAQLTQQIAHPTRLVIGGLVALVSGAGAEPLLEGRVRLPSGATPAGVQVRLFDIADLGRSLHATTDESGYFALPLNALRQTASLPAHIQLGQNYPNPFNPSTIIPYQLPAPTRVRLEVFNILGQRVATLVDGKHAAGFHTATWNATDASGRGVATGVYLYRLLAGGERLTRSMLLLDGAMGSAATASSGGATSAGPQGTDGAADPSGRTAGAIASGSWVPAGGQGQVYGLTVTSPGLVPYVDPAFWVGGEPVEIQVQTLASLPRGKMAPGGLLGDVDGNGRVDLSDALLVASYIEDPSLSIPNGDITLGDVNRDGQVDLADALLIVAYHVDPSDLSLPDGIGAPLVADDEGPRLYWTDSGSDKIQRSRLDGSGVEDVVDSGLVYPRGMAVDVAACKLYWTDYGTDKIQRANLDGSEVEDLITTGLRTPLALALDAAAGKLYWTDNGTDKIQRTNLDGSDVEDLVTGLQSPLSLALDVSGGKLYWTDSGTDKIQRANLDGSEIEDLVTTGLSIPRGLALDAAGGKLYWTDNGTDKIQRANLDGTEIEDLVTTGLHTPRGLIVDVAEGKLYWADSGTDKIQRANFDGSEVEDLVTEGLQSPRVLALPRTPSTEDNQAPVAVPLVYWTDARTDRIQRSSLDGSDIRILVTGLKQPRDIALDRDGGRMYWTDSVVDKVQRANLDGSHAEDLVVEGLKTPFGIALDLARGKMYWTDWGIDKIQRANLDGSEIEDLITDGLNEPYGIALDVAEGKMYWTDWGADKIQRANLDGSEVEDLVTGLNQPRGIALDLAGGKMYWPDWGTNKIQRANLDGSQVEDLVTEGLRTSQAIALDLAAGKMYWTDYGTDKIQRANLDGSEVEDLVTEGLKEPYGLTLGAGLPAQVLKVEGDAATLNLEGRFHDPEGGTLTYTASSSDEAVATASVAGSVVTISPVATGRATFVVTARDEGGRAATLPVDVTVYPTNRPPVAGTLADRKIRIGRPDRVELSTAFADPDEVDVLTYTATSSNEAVATAAVEGTAVLIDPKSIGEIRISVTARDPEGLQASLNFGVTIESKPGPRSPSSGTRSPSSGSGGGNSVGAPPPVTSPQVLVSNLGQTTLTRTGGPFSFAQGFRTGTNDAGYTLTSIKLMIGYVAPEHIPIPDVLPTVTLHSGSAAGSKVVDFTTTSSGPDFAVYTFIPTTTVTLDMNTDYWVVASSASIAATIGVAGAGEDATPAPGWSIHDRGQYYHPDNGWEYFGADVANQFSVYGTIISGG